MQNVLRKIHLKLKNISTFIKRDAIEEVFMILTTSVQHVH